MTGYAATGKSAAKGAEAWHWQLLVYIRAYGIAIRTSRAPRWVPTRPVQAASSCHPASAASPVFTETTATARTARTTFAVGGGRARLGIRWKTWTMMVHGDATAMPFGMGTYGSRSHQRGWPPSCGRWTKIEDQGQEDRRT